MTDRYDYREAVKYDITRALSDHYWLGGLIEDAAIEGRSYDSIYAELYDALWTDDSVTGNGSGSYTFNTWRAEENLAHNWDLLADAADSFGLEPTISCDWRNGPEYWDVTIRCYLLDQVLPEVFSEERWQDTIERVSAEQE